PNDMRVSANRSSEASRSLNTELIVTPHCWLQGRGLGGKAGRVGREDADAWPFAADSEQQSEFVRVSGPYCPRRTEKRKPAWSDNRVRNAGPGLVALHVSPIYAFPGNLQLFSVARAFLPVSGLAGQKCPAHALCIQSFLANRRVTSC